MRPASHVSVLALAAGLGAATAVPAQDWSLEEAAEPYSGTTVDVVFLKRPGYEAAKEMIPEFTEKTGIEININELPYENALGQQVRDFVAGGDLDIALIDLVWLGNFVENGWVEPVSKFTSDPDLADPDLDMDDFIELPLKAFGEWNGELYGLPFDNYSGLMFYNQCMMDEAGFDRPPQTWTEVMQVYGPELTGDGQHAFALQSKRNETQSADSFARMLWPFGGSFLDEDFRSNLTDPASLSGLQFRQDLMQYMPEGIVSYDHAEAVNALAQGDVAFITEWSSFYSTLAESETSQIADCLGVAPEPTGPAGRKPALGGFSMAVTSQASEAEQAASWLFIQWITSKDNAREYLERGGVPARKSVYNQEGVTEEFPFATPLVKSWQEGVPEFRPRFAEWPEMSEIVQVWGTRMMQGQVSVEEGAQEIGARVEELLGDAGYYDGEKPLAQ